MSDNKWSADVFFESADAMIGKTSRNAVIKYFNGDELAANVYKDKYENPRDYFVKLSTPDNLHQRLADSISKEESNFANPMSFDLVYTLLRDFKYLIPGGSIMYGLNNADSLVSLSNCFVIGSSFEKDSYGAIMKRDEEQIQLMKRRGGVGQDLSFLRSEGSPVRNAAKKSTGVVPFAERYSNSIKEVAQDGRRGAGMLTLDFDHPDVMNFINAKANTDKITGANISIKIYDDDMESLSNTLDGYSKVKDPLMEFPIEDVRYAKDIKHNNNVSVEKRFNSLINNAREFSEPGILFWSRIGEQIDAQLYPNDFKPISTNPCGELPLSGDEACRLLSLVLYSYVSNPFTKKAEFNFELFEKHTIYAQRIMDDIINLEIGKINRILTVLGDEKEFEPFETSRDTIITEIQLWTRILKKTKSGRRTGLGFTALADAIAALGMAYGSRDSIDFAEEVASSFMKSSYKSSIILAKERGAFPKYRSSEWESNNIYINRIKGLFYDEPEILRMWERYGRRNIQNLAIAPTGTLSILAKTSSGIEPVFNLKYTRRRRALEATLYTVVDSNNDMWEEFNVVHPKLQVWYDITHEKSLDLTRVSDKEFEEIVKKSPYYKSTAHEISPEDKITMQGMIQKYIDSSISNTLNLPENVTSKQVMRYALYAWEIGLKGFTIYREGSRSGILINKKKKDTVKKFSQQDAAKRPKTLICGHHYITINGIKWIVLVGSLDNNPYEIFAFKDKNEIPNLGKELYSLTRVKRGHYNLTTFFTNDVVINDITTYFDKPEEEFITRLISTGLRHGTDVKHLHDQLLKSKGYITDFQKAIARVLKAYIKEESYSIKEQCPECSATLFVEAGCVTCKSCGYSKC